MNLQVYTQEESRVALPSGKSLKSDKYVKIDMEIENVLLPPVKLLVLDMELSIILGNEFLTARACMMDFAEKRLDFKYKQKTHQVFGSCKTQTKFGLNNILLSKLDKLPNIECYRVSHK